LFVALGAGEALSGAEEGNRVKWLGQGHRRLRDWEARFDPIRGGCVRGVLG